MDSRENTAVRVCGVSQEGEPATASDGSSFSGCHHGKIPEMGSVVASITGYSGHERSNLIKLINSSGAYFVGKLLKGSITHLVCWTFDGSKYEMAKRFKICILNHRWFEDCLKAGKRLDEISYTKLSGKEVGAVLWKAPMHEVSSPQHVKSKVLESSTKYAYNKDSHPRSMKVEGFCEALPSHGSESLVRTVSEETLDDLEDDYELELLLQNKPTKRDKRKASLVRKNCSLKYKIVPKHTRRSVSSPHHAAQRKHGDTRNSVTHGILEYVHLADDIEMDNNRSGSAGACRQRLQLDEIEDCYEVPSAKRAKSTEQQPLTILDSMKHRKERRLVRKTKSVDMQSSFDTSALETVDMGPTQKHNEATTRTEVINDESDYFMSPGCNAASFPRAMENFSGTPVACTLVPADIACVICHADNIASAEGVLACGHHFCYQCIMKWASEVASKRPTCPLCKAPFDMITKREQKSGSNDMETSYEESVVMMHVEKCSSEELGQSPPILSCILCGIGDMEELLLTCSGCGTRSAHSFCLDPPLPPLSNTPWFCGRCSQRRRADTNWWHQLHLFEG